MSSNIQISGPFIKQVFTCNAADGRRSNNPLYGIALTAVVPAPYRRMFVTIQNTNEGTGATALVVLDQLDNNELGGYEAIVLQPNQSITLDNYNGILRIATPAALSAVKIMEAFA